MFDSGIATYADVSYLAMMLIVPGAVFVCWVWEKIVGPVKGPKR